MGDDARARILARAQAHAAGDGPEFTTGDSVRDAVLARSVIEGAEAVKRAAQVATEAERDTWARVTAAEWVAEQEAQAGPVRALPVYVPGGGIDPSGESQERFAVEERYTAHTERLRHIRGGAPSNAERMFRGDGTSW